MAISFNQVPANARVPFTYVEIDASRAGASGVEFKSLLIGQRLDAGETAAAVPVLVNSAADARRAFGAGSMLEHMAAAFRRQNPLGELWAVALDDANNAVKAAVEVEVTAAATAGGTIALYIAGRRIAVGIAGAAAADAVATAINNAIQAVAAELPATSAVAGATVTITARHGGAATDLDVRHSYFPGEALPAGVALDISASANGATDPEVTAALDALSDEKFSIIATPYSAVASMRAIEEDLAERWGPAQQLDGNAIAAFRGTVGAATTYGNARNSAYTSVLDMADSPSPAYEWAAAAAGAVALSASIDPARPFQTLPLAGILPAPVEGRRSFAERNGLLHDGIATHTVDSGGVVRIERMITTWQEINGVPDAAFLDLNTPLTLSWLRADFRARMQTKYGRFKLADDATRIGPGQAVMTPNQGRAEAIAWFRAMEERGLVENGDGFKEGLIVERNADDPNRLDFLLPPDLVNQLRVVGAQLSFIL